VKIGLPPQFGNTDFDITLFDATHNNPARSGDPAVHTLDRRNAGDLVLEMQPNSLVILASP
jgi:hypothetical protein